MFGLSPAGYYSTCSGGSSRYPSDETTPSYSQSSRILPPNHSRFATSIRSVMINYSLISCDSPPEGALTLPSVGPFLVKGTSSKVAKALDFDPLSSLQRGCPVPDPLLAGCQLIHSEAPSLPLPMDTIPEHFGSCKVELRPD